MTTTPTDARVPARGTPSASRATIRLHRAPAAVLPIGACGPVDDLGRLVHADDPAAQLALALARVEAIVTAAGLAPTDLAQLRVMATDLPAVLGVLDTLTERLAELGADPALSVIGVTALPLPGMLVALDGLAIGTPAPAGATQARISERDRDS